MQESETTTRAFLFYGLRSAWSGGLIGGVVGGVVYVLALLLSGLLDVLISSGSFPNLIPEGVTLLVAPLGYGSLLLLSAIGGAGLGLLGGTIAGPITAYILYRVNPRRNWLETGAILGGCVGLMVPFVLTGDDVLTMMQGMDMDVIGLFIVHMAGVLGGAVGGTVAGWKFDGYLEQFWVNARVNQT